MKRPFIPIALIVIAILALVVFLVFDIANDTAIEPRKRKDPYATEIKDKEMETITGEPSTSAPTEERKYTGDPFYGEDDITLTVWVSESAMDITKELCDDFIASHPEKKISIEVESHEEEEIDYDLMSNPKKGADVFSFTADRLDLLNRYDILAPVVSDYIEDVKTYHSERSVRSASINGKLMAYPETEAYSYCLVYDKSCVSDKDAQTLSGVLEACRKAKKKFVMDADNGYYSCIFPFTGGLSANGFTEDGEQAFNVFDEEKVLDSLEAFAKLFNEYSDVILNASVDKIGDGMSKSGNVAAGIDSYQNIPADQEKLGKNFGSAKLPTVNIKGTDAQIISACGAKLLGVNAYSAFPESSQTLADYLAGYDCQSARLKQLDWIPSIKELQSGDAVTGNAWMEALLAQSERAVLQSGISLSFWEPIGDLGDTVFSGTAKRSELKEELENALKKINSDYQTVQSIEQKEKLKYNHLPE